MVIIKKWCPVEQRIDWIPKCNFRGCDNLTTHTWQDGAFGDWMCEGCIPKIVALGEDWGATVVIVDN